MKSKKAQFARPPCVAIRRMYLKAHGRSRFAHAMSLAIIRELTRHGRLEGVMSSSPNQVLIEGDSAQSPTIDDQAEAKLGCRFIPLSQELRDCIPTADAAFHLGRKPQTLRVWACNQCGPIEPARVGGRLMWSVKAIKEFMKTSKSQAKDL